MRRHARGRVDTPLTRLPARVRQVFGLIVFLLRSTEIINHHPAMGEVRDAAM
jgi:hypothetical protein